MSEQKNKGQNSGKQDTLLILLFAGVVGAFAVYLKTPPELWVLIASAAIVLIIIILRRVDTSPENYSET